MTGKIIKGIAGFYYVDTGEDGIITCKAKGIFRKDGTKPLVGDDVRVESLGIDEKTGESLGNIVEILPRKNSLIRPEVANVDGALVIFAAASPAPNLELLDRFLVSMEYQDVPVSICFNKADLEEGDFLESVKNTYEKAGYGFFITSTKEGLGIEKIRDLLRGKTTTVAGPSGVGKSSIINELLGGQEMATGDVSEKIGRGRHTTRHSELLKVEDDTYIFDTPGFSSLYVPDMDLDEIRYCFPEIREFEGQCKFAGCTHRVEPGCAVKEAFEKGQLDQGRYENYKSFAEAIFNKKRY